MKRARVARIGLGAWLVLPLLVGAVDAKTLAWQQGWDDFGQPLNLAKSHVSYSINATTRHVTLTYFLVGSQVDHAYQVGIHVFCTTFAKKFGRFPVPGAPACGSLTRQGVTKTANAVEFGAIITDAKGNGSVTVDVGAVAAGTYTLEFDVRDGAGCDVTGGGGSGECPVGYQSPGPFGTGATLVVPGASD